MAGEWTVAAAAHHAAAGLPMTFSLVEAIATGQGLPPITMELVNAQNNQVAAQNARISTAEVLGMLRTNGVAVLGKRRALSDEQLATRTPLALLGGGACSAAPLAEMVLIVHTSGHMASMLAAAQARAAAGMNGR